MPENEIKISYLEVVKLVKATANKTRLRKLQDIVNRDATGVIYAYRKGDIKFEIKRYRTGNFIKKVY